MTDWKKTTLGQVAQVFTGFPFKSNDYSEDPHDIKLLRGDNIAQGTLRWDDAKKWPKSEYEKYAQYQLKEDDVVLAMDRPWIGAGLKYSSVRKEDLPSLLVQRTARLRGSAELDIIYLKYIIASPWFSKYIQSINTGSLVPHISSKQIKDFPVNLPSVQQQKRLSSVLAAIDNKIDINNRINAELEAMAKTLYDYWFVQFDFPDTNGKPYKASGGKMVYNATLKREIPVGWNTSTLWNIAKYTNGLAMQKYREDSDVYLPVIKIREMNNGISAETERARVDIPEAAVINDGDVLFSWSATLDVKIWSQGEGALNQHIFKVSSDSYPKSFYYFELLNYLKHFKMIAELRKTTMGHITLDHLKQAYICLPPLFLLEEFNSKVHDIFQQHLLLEKENRSLIKLRDWLLPLLMNGQVTVK
ncbi:restriction endonuclease subunit S [Salmonella enterica]|nr:restriction endonuclease subunit S [Salmonella enterica subsp. enterica serovar Idikan]ECE0997280.1 restriction endonuclease subunit S [Salmonella enterica subsp. enterica serovar Bere]EHS0746657.1 restriction endonuclease subunit S [Salmonella enterica]EDT7270570.1 restriction endonuclease subunit S [Salmonella enterica subsp. enterica serovar Bere]EHS0776289.1 restriction endonuclease subunit S [Salmonella enterica]